MTKRHITVASTGHTRFQVWLNDVLVDSLDVIEAKESGQGQRNGFVIRMVYALDGRTAARDEDGKPRTRVEFGKVELKEIPR